MEVDVKLIAFYLPQFHPIPENDQWWGKGFTEWNKVVTAKPSFPGHHQPHLPAELGFYDLRVPETREAQAALAREHGIHGFCYYFYWFKGKRLLERPLNEMLASGTPNFPFCVCWANESWSRRWDGRANDALITQTYSADDDIAMIDEAIRLFRDPRYIRVNGRPLLVIWRATELPDPAASAARFRARAREQGMEDPYLCLIQSGDPMTDPGTIGFDAALEFPPHRVANALVDKVALGAAPSFSNDVIDYTAVAQEIISRPWPEWTHFKGVMPSWDNTARRPDGGITFINSHPQNYWRWLKAVVGATRARYAGDERIVFINAWNEWAEGCHLEPDQLYGRAYLEATKAALLP